MMRKFWLQSAMLLWVIINSLLCKHAEAQTRSLMKCKEHEQQALLRFKQSFTEDPMNRLSSWVGKDCCQWRGVTCDDITGNVIKVNLSNYPYVISEVDNSCYAKQASSLASNGLSSALLELSHLTHLDLSWNDFNGTPIPEFLGSMSNLRYLNLSEAGFSGLIPPELGNLTNLIGLSLSTKCDHHGLFAESLGWMSSLLTLQSLDLGGSKLSSAQDTLQVLSWLPSLLMLTLSDTGLQNTHLFDSSDKCFTRLEHLDLSSNFIGGSLPYKLKHMSSLKFLSLGFNNFNGSIPSWIGSIEKLEFLDLGFNYFSGHLEGGVWGIMSNPCSFRYMDLSGYEFRGEILKPSESSSHCSN